MRVIVMIGIPGSGKTTLADKEFADYTRISLDIIKGLSSKTKYEIRQRYTIQDAELLPYKPSNNRKVEFVLMREALEAGQNVLVDDTNVTRMIRMQHVRLAEKYGAGIRAIFFMNIQRAYMQNEGRKNPVPKSALGDFHRDLEIPHEDEGFESIRIV